jgi:hypothetical protein
MDPKPHAVHTTQCDEYPTLRSTPGSKRMREIVVILLPRRLLMVEPSHHHGSNLDQLDHRVEHAGP